MRCFMLNELHCQNIRILARLENVTLSSTVSQGLKYGALAYLEHPMSMFKCSHRLRTDIVVHFEHALLMFKTLQSPNVVIHVKQSSLMFKVWQGPKVDILTHLGNLKPMFASKPTHLQQDMFTFTGS